MIIILMMVVRLVGHNIVAVVIILAKVPHKEKDCKEIKRQECKEITKQECQAASKRVGIFKHFVFDLFHPERP